VTSITGKTLPALTVFAYMIKFIKDQCLICFNGMTCPALPYDQIQWVLTVPAFWPEPAKDFMREAALQAGLIEKKDSEHLLLALEPEAAALYVKQKPVSTFGCSNEDLIRLRERDKYLVIDAGGSTIDITGYEVVEGLKEKQLIVANGGDWGGAAVEMEVRELLIKVFGKALVDAATIIQRYELILLFKKHLFKVDTGSNKIIIQVPYFLPKLCETVFSKTIIDVMANIENATFNCGLLTFYKPHLLFELFEATINKIKKHVTEVLKNPQLKGFSYVMLVGGFGECKLLQQAIQDILPKECKLIIPDQAHFCVASGAVYFCFHLDEITSMVEDIGYTN
jgi:hypothetical protein